MRLGLRLLLGFVLYAALCTAWLLAGLDDHYDRLVFSAAGLVVPILTHFPIGASELSPVTLHNQGYVLVLAVSLGVVAARLSWKQRLARYGTALAAIVTIHVVGMALQMHLGLALKFQERTDVPLLLDWELRAITVTFQLLFLMGLQIAAFVLLVLTAAWSTEHEFPGWPGRETSALSVAGLRLPGSRQRLVAAGALLAIGAAIVGAAWQWRERSPQHVRAHAYVGHLFLDQGNDERAERQYRAAIRAGSTDGRTWFNLIALMDEQGRIGEVRRLANRAREVVTDPAWRQRLPR